MCGLYSFRRSPEEVRAFFRYVEEPLFPPRPHVAPGAPIAIVRQAQGARRFALARWGLVPAWMKELKPGKPLINARGETVMEKASFRHAMRRRRCLVPADGYYEWRGEPGRKQAFHIRRPDHSLFAFAGLWEHWQSAEGSEIESAAIITTAANADIAPIHDRMPAIIMPEDFAAWLDVEAVDAVDAHGLIAPAPAGFLTPEPSVMQRQGKPPAQRSEQPRLL